MTSTRISKGIAIWDILRAIPFEIPSCIFFGIPHPHPVSFYTRNPSSPNNFFFMKAFFATRNQMLGAQHIFLGTPSPHILFFGGPLPMFYFCHEPPNFTPHFHFWFLLCPTQDLKWNSPYSIVVQNKEKTTSRPWRKVKMIGCLNVLNLLKAALASCAWKWWKYVHW